MPNRSLRAISEEPDPPPYVNKTGLSLRLVHSSPSSSPSGKTAHLLYQNLPCPAIQHERSNLNQKRSVTAPYATSLGEWQLILILISSSDPACGTCRRKCRKCDRTRPVCKRCVEKGLHCEGYPPKYTFWDYNGDSGTSTSQAETVAKGASEKDDQPSSAGPSEPSLDDQTPNSPSSQLIRDASLHAQQSPLSDGSATSVGTILDGQEWLLAHCKTHSLFVFPRLTDNMEVDETMADNIAIAVPGMMNPFRQHILPLAQQHGGVMHALLGLSAGHVCTSHRITGRPIEAVSLEHRVAALETLGSMLLQESSRGLDGFEEDCVLAIVLLLVLHDVSVVFDMVEAMVLIDDRLLSMVSLPTAPILTVSRSSAPAKQRRSTCHTHPKRLRSCLWRHYLGSTCFVASRAPRS